MADTSNPPQHQCTQRNLITDVAGLKLGNAHDAQLRSGVTVVLPEAAAVAAIDVRGGGPGTRESDALALGGAVNEVHGIVLSGGSAFGLSAATGVQSWLAERGIGYRVGAACVPIVPQAILFDLLNGGDKAWGASPPYERLARQACEAAALEFEIGTAGAGYGANTATLKGGLGSASACLPDGTCVGAVVAVNAVGSVTVGDGPQFWAAPFERGREFGGLGFPSRVPADALWPPLKGSARENTTIAIIATDATLTRPEARRLAILAQTGLARAIYPVHTPLDGDVVFALATGHKPPPAGLHGLTRLGALAADVLARAVARGVYEARSFAERTPPCWRDKFGAS